MASNDAGSGEGKAYLYEIEGMHEASDGVLYLPSTPEEHLENIKNFDMTAEDMIVATFSKSGTTWLQEVSYLIHNGVDTIEAKSRPITKRVPFIDYDRMWPLVTSLESPRLIKTHLRADYYRKQVMEQKVKVAVMMRNPKDTLVSFYHFYKMNKAFGCFSGTWDEFFALVQNKQLIYGDWFDYTLAWWKLRDLPNVLILKYEDLKLSPTENIQKLAAFMGHELNESQLTKITEATSFDTMKHNPSVSYSDRTDFLKKGSSFMRKGSTGDWKNYFTVAQNQYFDKLYERHMAGTNLEFIFDIET